MWRPPLWCRWWCPFPRFHVSTTLKNFLKFKNLYYLLFTTYYLFIYLFIYLFKNIGNVETGTQKRSASITSVISAPFPSGFSFTPRFRKRGNQAFLHSALGAKLKIPLNSKNARTTLVRNGRHFGNRQPSRLHVLGQAKTIETVIVRSL